VLCVAEAGETRRTYNILGGKLCGKKFVRHRRPCQKNSKINITEKGFDDMSRFEFI
jgi:hypothetical protein